MYCGVLFWPQPRFLSNEYSVPAHHCYRVSGLGWPWRRAGAAVATPPRPPNVTGKYSAEQYWDRLCISRIKPEMLNLSPY